jgi:thermostable 8-oxoguanine DNA glycosylase
MRREAGGVTSGGPTTKRAGDWEGALRQLLEEYRYQRELTECLDALGPQPFTQDVIKDIVLWKVNRYVKLSAGALAALNSVTEFQPKSHRNARDALATLLDERGVDLPMASSFLRFRNRKAFQIIDRHAYRAVYGQNYPLYSSSTDKKKIDLYFCYLDDLFMLAGSKEVDFASLDRVLYIFDKQINGKL